MAKDTFSLDKLYQVLAARKDADPDESYTARLYAKGRARIVRKFGEEAVELSVAALAEGRDEVIAESGDVLYHLLVLWAEQGIAPEEVWQELERRFGTSGIDEKAARKYDEKKARKRG